MQKPQHVLDDIARVAGGAVGVFSGLSQQIKEDIRSHVEDVAARLNLVPREDFETLETMLSEARKAQIDLEKRVAKLETKLAKKK